MPLVIAIDAGTTGVRSVAVNEKGVITGSSYREFTQHFPQPGRVEHDATEIWEAVKTTFNELHASLFDEIVGIGITFGSAWNGTPSRSQRYGSQAAVRMSKSIVRLAFDGSVACTAPPVRFHRIHESTVPISVSGVSATPPSLNSQPNLVPEK